MNKELDTSRIQNLKHLSPQDFLNFGIREYAYIRVTEIDDRKAYVIHAADGTALKVMDDYARAEDVALNNELEPVRLH